MLCVIPSLTLLLFARNNLNFLLEFVNMFCLLCISYSPLFLLNSRSSDLPKRYFMNIPKPAYSVLNKFQSSRINGTMLAFANLQDEWGAASDILQRYGQQSGWYCSKEINNLSYFDLLNY